MGNNVMKTFSASAKNMDRKWYLIDATDLVLGRMSVVIADYLRGKHKPVFTPNLDCGDYIIVINADKIHLTGSKLSHKKYFHHTGYPGGLKETTAEKIMASKFPERIIEKSVERMITRNALGRAVMKKLFVYGGAQNPHSAQKPELLDVASMNTKNKKRK